MKPSDRYLFGAQGSRAIDAYAIKHLPIAGYTLMQRAGEAAFASLLQNFPGIKGVSVVCGKGNNAGDAYLVARHALELGLQTQVVSVIAPEQLSGDAALAYQDAVAAGVQIESDDTAQLTGDVIVDGLLGTGLNGAPRPPFNEAIAHINASGKPVLSIDIPSGVSADTGAVAGDAVRARVTVSFITRKLGLYTGAGVSYAGQREFADLGVPAQMYTADGYPRLFWSPADLPDMDANTYKHRQGHIVVAGGDADMPGAVSMAAAAALRVGGGMVTALTRDTHRSAIVGRIPEVMVHGYHSENTTGAEQLLERASLIVLGPGLGRGDWGRALYQQVQQANKPTVLDADGLYWLAQAGGWQGGPLTITPHVGEAARLLNCPAAQVQNDRIGCARTLAAEYACQGVLKGVGSVVFAKDGKQLAICAHGNPGMATAGMGDVLSGVLGGLLAGEAVAGVPQSYTILAAGVALHSAAADHAVQHTGLRSLLASDVIAALPELLRVNR
jgi:ADP-dependent NAD(P)H-hydrate dehydratase / NAD(P)H-hydrate epimerase